MHAYVRIYSSVLVFKSSHENKYFGPFLWGKCSVGREHRKAQKDEHIIIVPLLQINTLNSVCVKSFSIFIDKVRP